MSMTISGHAAASGFEAPLEMLSGCHRRVERQCATLRRLVAHLLGRDPDEDASAAAAAVMRYFDTAAKDHHADEEIALFPALIESMAGSDAICIRELIDSLTLEHRALDSRWQRLREVLHVISAGDSVSLDPTDVEPFICLHERHIAREEAELLPMARGSSGTMHWPRSARRCASGAASRRSIDVHLPPAAACPSWGVGTGWVE